jgi:hypothetical protein
VYRSESGNTFDRLMLLEKNTISDFSESGNGSGGYIEFITRNQQQPYYGTARIDAIYDGTDNDEASTAIVFWTSDGTGSGGSGHSYSSGANTGGSAEEAERMRINHDGKVGISKTNPSYNLDIGYNGSNNDGFRITGSSRTITIRNDELNSIGGLYLNYNGNAVYYSGNNQISSDNRIKHNEKPLSNALKIINKLKPQKYFKSFKMYDENHNYELDSSGVPITNDKFSIETGFIAQDIQEIPELSYLVKEIPDKSYTEEIDLLDENGERVMVEDENGRKIPKKETKSISRPSRLSLSYTDIFVYNINFNCFSNTGITCCYTRINTKK